jgi:enoyl-CoA hydratase/carnithine racemase
VHNAFGRRVRDELADALTVALADAATEVLLAGDGPSFCSGGDLDEFGTFTSPPAAHVVRLTRSPARLMAALADRVTVHLHGACMGAGIELPAFAHRIVAAADTVIALPELSLGLVPGAGGTVSLPRRIGRQRTAWLALTGFTVDAATALRWGLVDELA